MAAAAAPASLSQAGKALWKSITGGYQLRADELELLVDVCQITDMIDALEKAWADDGRPMTTKGSMGQQVIHPLIGEIRAQRMARNTLWRQLKLPDPVTTPQPNQNREAAGVRHSAPWAVRGA